MTVLDKKSFIVREFSYFFFKTVEVKAISFKSKRKKDLSYFEYAMKKHCVNHETD